MVFIIKLQVSLWILGTHMLFWFAFILIVKVAN